MASLRRGLVDKVKQAAEKVGKRGAQVAAKAGTRGARALVETTAAAVKQMDKLQSKLGRGSRASSKRAEAVAPKAKRASTTRTPEALPVALRESGRKTTPASAAAAKRSKAPAHKKEFKAKRGQKHLHSGR